MSDKMLFVIVGFFFFILGARASCEASWYQAQLTVAEDMCRPGHVMGLVDVKDVGIFVACVYDSTYQKIELKRMRGR